MEGELSNEYENSSCYVVNEYSGHTSIYHKAYYHLDGNNLVLTCTGKVVSVIDIS